MAKVVGGFAALVALAGGIIARVDPVTSLWRAGLAFLLGWLITQVWYVFFTVRIQHTGIIVSEPATPQAKSEDT